MAQMSKRERVGAALQGDPVDRVPVGFWGHDYLREWSAEGTAAAMLEMQRRWDLDFLKVNPRATYYMEAWGYQVQPSGDPATGPEVLSHVVRSSADLRRLEPVDGRAGPFAEQLRALDLIAEGLGGDVPFVQTLFSPLAVLGRMTEGGPSRLRELMHAEPEATHHALGAIAQTLSRYGAACLDHGADGIFFATVEWASHDTTTPEEYREFGRRHDLTVLREVEEAGFNVLHVCRDNNMLLSLLDYPVTAFHWAATLPGNPRLAAVQAKTDAAVMGGIGEVSPLLHGTPEEVAAQAKEALSQTRGRRFLLSAGCSISPQTPPQNLEAALGAVRRARRQG